MKKTSKLNQGIILEGKIYFIFITAKLIFESLSQNCVLILFFISYLKIHSYIIKLDKYQKKVYNIEVLQKKRKE